MPAPARSKGKIGVLIEDHFDEIEYREFNQFFPDPGYEVVYLSHLRVRVRLVPTSVAFSAAPLDVKDGVFPFALTGDLARGRYAGHPILGNAQWCQSSVVFPRAWLHVVANRMGRAIRRRTLIPRRIPTRR